MTNGRGFDPLTIEARIRAYASFGPHRTGWPADDRTTAWLIEELRSAGIDAARERFHFPRFEVRSAALTWDNERIEGEPMSDGGVTPVGGLIGNLAEADDPEPLGKILFAADAMRDDARWNTTEVRDHYDALAAEGVLGAVVPAGDPLGEVTLRNAVHIDRPFRLPVLVIARRDVRRVTPALMMRTEVTLEIDADRLDSTATNVTATIPGDDPAAAPLVVMTPKSGWFACAAERGGGLAAWLAIAEALAAMPARRRTVHLVATSGHELNRNGMHAYLRERAVLVGEAACWVHLGASIGAADTTLRVGASDPALEATLRNVLESANLDGYEFLATGDPGVGEARHVHEAGGRYTTAVARHPYFHSPNDTVDVAVDLPAVERWVRAEWDLVRTLMDWNA